MYSTALLVVELRLCLCLWHMHVHAILWVVCVVNQACFLGGILSACYVVVCRMQVMT